MARGFSYFYIPATVRTINNYTFNMSTINSENINSCTLFLGVRLQTSILMSNDFYKSLGFLSNKSIETLQTSQNPDSVQMADIVASDASGADDPMVKQPIKQSEVEASLIFPTNRTNIVASEASGTNLSY